MEYFFFEIWRSEKRIALSEKKSPLSSLLFLDFNNIMIATGYGCAMNDSLCFSKRTEVIDLQITNNRCSKLESYPTSVTLASGGLLNGKPVICGGQSRNKHTFSDCYILEQWFTYLGRSSVDLLMCRSWNFESRIFFMFTGN